MKDASELNRLLIDRMAELATYLFPKGKIQGDKLIVGGMDGSPGESLQVTISGSAAGRYIDFANTEDKGGTPLWLWSKARGISFSEAIKEASDWAGVKSNDFGIKRGKEKNYAKPQKDGVRAIDSNTPIMDYLVVERKLDPIVVAKSKIEETEDGKAMVFNFAEWNDENKRWSIAHRKFLRLERPDGKKDSWSSKGTKRCLYGKQLVDDNVRDLVITEGEIDALSYLSYGIPAVSIPNGVADMEWIDIDWDWLSRFEKIYISTDMDEPGRQVAPQICKRLGLHRCYIVSLPKKDANECLVAGVKKEDMDKCLKLSKPIELDEIKRPDDFKKDVLDHYATDPAETGFMTPWYPDLPWRVRRGEYTVFSGFGGHGKTQGLNQLMISLINQGCKIMDASLEIRPSLTLYYMTRCALGKKNATQEEATACIEWLNEAMFFLDCIGTVNVDRIMHAMEYARKRHGIDVFVIDSLFKCGMSPDDHGAQREFADKLTTFCNNTGAHVILVAHTRKTMNGNELSVPSKSDVAGSSDITNAAFNVIIFWRNKLKKKKLDEAKQANNVQGLTEWIDANDGVISIDKQRFGEGEESSVFTWFDKESCQFHTQRGMKLEYFSSK
jgi:twinkle protein